MAEAFNKAHHETSSGRRIEIKLVKCDSVVQRDDLVSRATGGGPIDKGCAGPNPTIVTPQADDWLVDVNQRAKRTVVDLHTTKSIAKTLVGIVTYRGDGGVSGLGQEADRLPRPHRPREDGGGASHGLRQTRMGGKPCSRSPIRRPRPQAERARSLTPSRPKRPVEELTTADVDNPQVRKYVKDFQQLVAHYMPGTIPLNTKIAQGNPYGHFFLMPEDNLVSLRRGTERAIGPDGKEQTVPPVGRTS